MRRIALVTGLVALALVIALALGWWRQGRSGPVPERPLATTATLGTPALSFGDPLSAQIEVLVDPRRVDLASVRVRPRFTPWRIVSSSTERRSAAGTLLTYRYTLECLSPECVPGQSLAERRFLPALVSYRSQAGRAVRLPVDWPTYRVATRLTSPDIGDPTEHLDADTSLPAVSYRIAPGTLQALLAAFSALLVLAAGVLVYYALPRRRAAAREPDLRPLERALLLVRASTANGYPTERRKALGGLARELRAEGRRDLAQAAVRLAWSSHPPSSEAASAFADRVEESL
jgi:hypothetical protein